MTSGWFDLDEHPHWVVCAPREDGTPAFDPAQLMRAWRAWVLDEPYAFFGERREIG